MTKFCDQKHLVYCYCIVYCISTYAIAKVEIVTALWWLCRSVMVVISIRALNATAFRSANQYHRISIKYRTYWTVYLSQDTKAKTKKERERRRDH